MERNEKGYEALKRNLIDIVAEEQAKLGYRKEMIRLYYPLSSLNHFFDSTDSSEDMENRLKDFPDYTSTHFHIEKISHKDDRFCFCLSPDASEYVYNNREKNEFLYQLIELLQKPHTTSDAITEFFRSWDSSCSIERIDTEDFDLLIRFVTRDDPYYYCFKDEGFHIIYHRFLPADYVDLNL